MARKGKWETLVRFDFGTAAQIRAISQVTEEPLNQLVLRAVVDAKWFKRERNNVAVQTRARELILEMVTTHYGADVADELHQIFRERPKRGKLPLGINLQIAQHRAKKRQPTAEQSDDD